MFSSRLAITESYRVMSQLRTQYSQTQYLEKITHQLKSGYHLCGMRENNKIVSVAGFRFSNSLAMGRHIYIEDFVTDETQRQSGYGKKLLDGIIELGNEEGVKSILLDSGVQRFGAHQFYVKNAFDIKAYLMLRSLTPVPDKQEITANAGTSCIPIRDDQQIASCFSLMRQLRPAYTEEEFLKKIR